MLGSIMQKKIKILVGVAACLVVGGVLSFYYFKGIKRRHGRGILTIDLIQAVGAKNTIPVAVIGSGPAGLSAALYAARLGFYCVVFQGKNPGGQLVGTSYVENWPGVPKTMGADIILGLQKQAQQFGAVVAADSIAQVDFSTWPFKLITEDKKEVQAFTVVIATGSAARRLNVPGEQEYWGKGVTTCAICDAPFYKNKDVIVVGGGDSAVEEVMQLAPYARTIQLFVRAEALRASHAMQENLKHVKQLTISYKSRITAIKGDEKHVHSVDCEKNGVKSTEPIDGVFLAIGHEPNTALFKNVIECRPSGSIKPLPGTQKTSLEGVYVAGDVADERYRQAGVASGDGIKAALDAAAFLHEHGYNEQYAEMIEPFLYVPEDASRKSLQAITSLEELDALIAESKLPVLVDFYTPYCPSCMQMLPAVESLAAQYEDDLVVVKVDGSKLKEVMDRWSVATVPHVLVFKDGALVARSKEVMSKRELATFVKQFVS